MSVMMETNTQLTPDLPNDPDCSHFTLRGGSVWITVETVSVWIQDAGDAVTLELLRHRDEGSGNPLDTGIVYFPAKAVSPEAPLPEQIAVNTQLTPDEPDDPHCTDFTLHTWNVWIRVRNLSVSVRNEDDFVIVEVFPFGDEAAPRAALDTAIAYFYDVPDDEEDDTTDDLDNGGAGVCLQCGEEFSPDDYGQQFCSEACVDAYYLGEGLDAEDD